MDKSELKRKLDRLEEIKNIRDFLRHDDDYTVKIKRKSYSYTFDVWQVFNKKITISKDVLEVIVNELVTYYENDIDKFLGDDER